MSSNRKLIIFDYDGVLVDTFPVTCMAYKEIFKEFKINRHYEPEEFRYLFEADWKKFVATLGITSKEDIKKVEDIFRKVVLENKDSIRLFPAIKQLLTTLKDKGHNMVIVSNNYERVIRTQLDKEGVSHYFDHILDVSHGLKPDPAGVLVALKKLNAGPDETILVGDMDADIEAAKKAKLKKVIAVDWGYHHVHKLKDADVIVHSPEQLLEEINKI
jgi:HAD superfamily hydrolase (TIGR01509 family)